MLNAAAQSKRLTDAELAKVAWTIIDATSRDPRYATQLTAEQWIQLGRFMGMIVLLYEAP